LVCVAIIYIEMTIACNLTALLSDRLTKRQETAWVETIGTTGTF
jgi:hypothetical protein